MISTVLAMMLMAAPSPEAVARARTDYKKCLNEFMNRSLKEQAAAEAFASGIGPACAEREKTFRTLVVQIDTAAGIKRAAAEENAGVEIEDMQANIREMFQDAAAPRPN